MKKVFVLLLALVMVVSLVACDKQGDTPSDNTERPDTSQSNDSNGDNQGNNNNNTNNNNNNNDTTDNGVTQAAMEAEILRRLSAISSLTSLTLCGGDKITYTPDGLIMAGDWWVIENPSMGKDEFMASVDAQLTAAGFTSDYGLMGIDYTVKAGPGSIGINVWYNSDENELTFRTTNHRDEYTAAFIEAENQKLPTIIESIDIIDKLPENFSVSFTTATSKYTLCRYNGSYMVTSESLNQAESNMVFTSYNVALSDGNGGYSYYDWYDILYVDRNEVKEGTPQERDCFMSHPDETVDEQIKKILEPLSVWGRMCWDYKELPVDGDRFLFDKASAEYSISENMTKVGEETYLGRNCEKVHSEGVWADTYDIIFDLETGMIMKMTVQDSGQGEVETYVEVSEYNESPASLGNFVQP